MTDRLAAQYRADIDGLRAVAVISVMLFHVGLLGFDGGFVGVDVFFVISGFLITDQIVRNIERGTFTFADFYLRRVRRLVPALVATLFLSLCAASYLFSPTRLEQFGASATAALLASSNVFFWFTTGYFDAAAITKPALHTWSLSVEEQFYFFWPAYLAALFYFGGRKGALVGVILAGSVSFGCNLLFHYAGSHFVAEPNSAMFYLLPFRVFELAIGAAAVWGRRLQPPKGFVAEALSFLSLSAIVASMFVFSATSVWPSFNSLLPTVATGLFMFAGPNHIAKRLIDNRLVAGFGLISYSLYLVHWPVIVFWTEIRGGVLSVSDKALMCGVSVGLALAMFVLVERPVRTRRVCKTPVSLACAGAVSVFGLAALSFTAFAGNGWTWRYGPEIAQLLDLSRNPRRHNPIRTRCFFGKFSPSEMPRECYSTQTAGGRKTVMIVGDSVANSLWYGLQQALGPAFDVKMWTSSACPPVRVFFAGRPDCKNHMDAFFEKVLPTNHYDLVVFVTGSGPHLMQRDFARSVETMRRLDRRFVLLGFPLMFDRPLPDLIVHHGRTEGLDEFIATHLQRPCSDEYGFHKLVPPEEFVSIRELMCPDGRPTYKDEGALLIFDNFHFTGRGSQFLASRLVPVLRAKGLL